MIRGVYGKLGGGKGLVVVEEIATELGSGYRDVVTNVPLRLDPWVNGRGEAQKGLLAYLRAKYGDDFNARARVLVIDDVEELATLFLWRRSPHKARNLTESEEPRQWAREAAARGWFRLSTTGTGGIESAFDARELEGCLPCLIVTDEAWKCYKTATLKKGGEEIVDFYGRQQRKLRDEWSVVTQHHADLAPIFARVAQSHCVVRNHGMERLGMFRQPAVFRVRQYTSEPKASAKCERETVFRLDVKGLAQTYDTSAGVGMAGGMQADHGARRKGIHIAWLGVAVMLLIVGLMAVPPLLGKATLRGLQAAGPAVTVPRTGLPETVPNNSPPLPVVPAPAVPPAVEAGAPVVADAYASGMGVCVGGRWQRPVFLEVVGPEMRGLLPDGRAFRLPSTAEAIAARGEERRFSAALPAPGQAIIVPTGVTKSN